MISKKKNWDGLNWRAKIFKKRSCLLKLKKGHMMLQQFHHHTNWEKKLINIKEDEV